ncbi:helix-turn-helix transcriptional regulator [Georgenia sp. TF02-10]|uniref:winged helix-turn-helix transcriptional regulator n=1 Tax=Georgenia sp. TF02-10 TaxID=2917725 RepID=UPI001FA7548E|nr:helix-turn-helix domain-containing protein [Georgenia sp. TF02-10]UNX55631.1 helix-turn-helix transcriptional regulator [Georgenia sp. TF02-10]
MERPRSGCPVNLAVELLGDGWSLLVLRDVMFADRHTFGELHTGSPEGIATNMLADRLHKLTRAGLLTREPVPGHKQKVHYRLTETALDLFPVLLAMAAFSLRHLHPDPELAAFARDLQEGGPEREAEVLARIRRANGLAEPRPAGAA